MTQRDDDAKGRFAGVSLFITIKQGESDFLTCWTDGGTVLPRPSERGQVTIHRAGYRVSYEGSHGPTPIMIDIRAGDYGDIDHPSLIVYETTPR